MPVFTSMLFKKNTNLTEYLDKSLFLSYADVWFILTLVPLSLVSIGVISTIVKWLLQKITQLEWNNFHSLSQNIFVW